MENTNGNPILRGAMGFLHRENGLYIQYFDNFKTVETVISSLNLEFWNPGKARSGNKAL